jgi:hypothetical protein
MTTEGIASKAGFSASIVVRLEPRVQRFFARMSMATVLCSVLVGFGASYGAWLASHSIVVAVVVGAALAGFYFNLFRLFHAGTGFPIHLPLEDLATWRPSTIGVLVLVALGAVLSQPLALFMLRSADPASIRGLIDDAQRVWQHPLQAAGVTVALSLCAAAPAWLRLMMTTPVRAYEQEKWLVERMLVDDAFADAQDIITSLLKHVPGFSGELQVHSADPPYHTKPLVFGMELMPSHEPHEWALVSYRKPARGRLAGRNLDTAPAMNIPQADVVPRVEPEAPTLDVPAPVDMAPAAPVELAPLVDAPAPEAMPSLDDLSDDQDQGPPPLEFMAVGRARIKRLRGNPEVIAHLAEHLNLPATVVEVQLVRADDDARVHEVFEHYKALQNILTKDAAHALKFQLAPILSVVTGRTQADVERRLRAAHPSRRLTGVFAAELARKLLGKEL